ncbi:hypothetical protein FO488_00950 [Geobacter sp. FeAm09]|uniref:hypothetical protein n=1 Tax=Geobacter sp. FeAm09 TaxID=2597769 RepID=UPI0011EC4B97|nr:hypothetical protein [Geobacter sp. FeAm09]QEM66865.1 hypothetical protein FO488_00950 [Geobacter sp. FeAm09]
MNDNADERLDRLFAATRTVPVDTSALEEHFETRLMARLAERRRNAIPWYVMMWRMVPLFAVLVAVIAVYGTSFSSSPSDDLFAAISTGQEEYLAQNILTGE